MQDRIKQMAEEAGFTLRSFNAIDGDEVLVADLIVTDLLESFARLVAEDCARLIDENAAQCSGMTADILRSHAEAIRARYAETKEG